MSNQTFDFSEAQRRMKEGKKVKRACWQFTGEIWIEQGKIYFKNIKSFPNSDALHINDYIPFFSWEDTLATDWEEVET